MDLENLSIYNLEDSKGTLYYVNAKDTRKPRLTLKHLNRMKKIKAINDMETIKRNKVITTMYGDDGDDESSAGGDLF